jgi:hypothetical protein
MFANIENKDVVDALKDIYDGYAVIDEEGVCLACIGVTEVDGDNAWAWALMSKDIGMRFFDIHKCVRAWLDGFANIYKYVWADVKEDFEEGKRWVDMLGFKRYNTQHNYYEDGSTANIYRRDKI